MVLLHTVCVCLRFYNQVYIDIYSLSISDGASVQILNHCMRFILVCFVYLMSVTKSGWEHQTISLGTYRTQGQWKKDCEQKAKDKGAAGFTVYRAQSDSFFWSNHEWYCELYTAVNSNPTLLV